MILKNTYIRIKDRKELRTHLFTAVFPAINHWFEKTVVETGDEFSITCIFITLFKNKVYSKFNNASDFDFHCKKTKQVISKSYF